VHVAATGDVFPEVDVLTEAIEGDGRVLTAVGGGSLEGIKNKMY
jgi:hypothetical protein